MADRQLALEPQVHNSRPGSRRTSSTSVGRRRAIPSAASRRRPRIKAARNGAAGPGKPRPNARCCRPMTSSNSSQKSARFARFRSSATPPPLVHQIHEHVDFARRRRRLPPKVSNTLAQKRSFTSAKRVGTGSQRDKTAAPAGTRVDKVQVVDFNSWRSSQVFPGSQIMFHHLV